MPNPFVYPVALNDYPNEVLSPTAEARLCADDVDGKGASPRQH